MPKIHLTTLIHAPAEIVFNLSRSITLHEKSMAQTNEKAIAGVTTGLIQKDETVTWRAKHLYKTRELQTKIPEMQLYTFFTDEMVQGDFKSMKHHHYFKPIKNGTIMIDEFYFESPYGILGRLVNHFFLTRYMKSLLEQRNAIIKEYAETQKWKTVLQHAETIE
ncbi:MAG TPA: SRPBCC family protein [Chitinophagaceae bacterium]|nr:SRPBCC family protein [Chitinophagaceae bacterium]